jgi:hypothetical protein
MSQPLNPKPTSGIANPSAPINPARPDSQGSIRSPLDGFRNPPRSRHSALQTPGDTPIHSPITPLTPRG